MFQSKTARRDHLVRKHSPIFRRNGKNTQKKG